MTTDIYLRTAKGRIHKGALTDADAVLVNEVCNLDDAPGTEEVLTQVPEDTEASAFCRHCFPDAPFPDTDEVPT